MDWLSLRVRLATCLGDGLDWLFGTPWELKKFNTSQLNQLKKFKKSPSGRDPSRTNFFNFFNWFSWEVFNFFNSEGVPAELKKIKKFKKNKKIKKIDYPRLWIWGSGWPGGWERLQTGCLTPLGIKKIQHLSAKSIKKIKKIDIWAGPPWDQFF